MPSDPLILSFDTSAAHCAAALLCGDRILAQARQDMAKGQAEAIMPMVIRLLEDEGLGVRDLDLIAVGIGPGNFTGTRISVAAARGLALGSGVPAMGVSMFEVMRGVHSASDMAPQMVCLGAPRDSLYVQEFLEGKPNGPPQHVVPWVDDIRVANPELTQVVGFEAGEVAHQLNAGADDGPFKGQPADLVDIAPTLARIASARLSLGETKPARPAPLYVRAADAAPPRDAAPLILQ